MGTVTGLLRISYLHTLRTINTSQINVAKYTKNNVTKTVTSKCNTLDNTVQNGLTNDHTWILFNQLIQYTK